MPIEVLRNFIIDRAKIDLLKIREEQLKSRKK